MGWVELGCMHVGGVGFECWVAVFRRSFGARFWFLGFLAAGCCCLEIVSIHSDPQDVCCRVPYCHGNIEHNATKHRRLSRYISRPVREPWFHRDRFDKVGPQSFWKRIVVVSCFLRFAASAEPFDYESVPTFTNVSHQHPNCPSNRMVLQERSAKVGRQTYGLIFHSLRRH